MDENGNFIFTLTDGSKMKMNVGKVESTVSIPASSLAEGMVIMSTYEEFMIILTTASLIIAILNYTHKK